MANIQKILAGLILGSSLTICGCNPPKEQPKETLKPDLGVQSEEKATGSQPKEKIVRLYDRNNDGNIDIIECEGYNYPCCKKAASHKERYSATDYDYDGKWDVIEGQTHHLFPEDRSGVNIVSHLVYNSPFGGRLDNILSGLIERTLHYSLYDTDSDGSIDKVIDEFGCSQPFIDEINQLLAEWKASIKKEVENYKK